LTSARDDENARSHEHRRWFRNRRAHWNNPEDDGRVSEKDGKNLHYEVHRGNPLNPEHFLTHGG
jgi:hypothetical protein